MKEINVGKTFNFKINCDIVLFLFLEQMRVLLPDKPITTLCLL